jgi:outer membrane lipoprotein-sorting protein
MSWAIFALMPLVSFTPPQSGVSKVSMTMVSRKAQKGQLITLRSEIFYRNDGRMVTRFTHPYEMITVNNAKGDLMVYNPKLNSVAKEYNYIYSSETSALYYFLKDNSNELGLRSLGFKLSKSSFENGYMITIWDAPFEYTKSFKNVELVYKDNKPVFMKFNDMKSNPVKKTYFYNYRKVAGANFPTTITNVYYNAPGDSVVEKVTYDNILFNENTSSPYFDYTIPADAKTVK